MRKGFSLVQFRSTSFNLVDYLSIYNLTLFFLQICPQSTRKSIMVTTQSCANSLATWCEFLKIADFSTNPIARSWNPQKVWKTFSHKNYPIWGKEWNLRPNVAGCYKLSMQELMQWNQFSFLAIIGQFWLFLGLFWLFLMYKCTIENWQLSRYREENRERKDLKEKNQM